VLDRTVPLKKGSHIDSTGYRVERGRLVVTLKNGTSTRARGDAGPEGRQRRARGGAMRRQKKAARHGSKGEGRRLGRRFGESQGGSRRVAARGIDKRGADSGGFRWQSSAARKEGKWWRSTRARFRAAGAPPGPRKCIPNLGWSRGTLREADNERRPLGQSKMAGEPTASGGGGRGGAN